MFTKPNGRRIRWFLALHKGSIKSPQVARFIRVLKKHRRLPVILLMDRLPAHRSRVVMKTIEANKDWLRIEWLPPYAPELNPVELLWGHLDATSLANTPIENPMSLRRRVRSGVGALKKREAVSRGFLKHTGLF